MGRWRRYSDATTIKDALQAGGTPSDMRNDFEKASWLSRISKRLELELELIQSHMTQKPMLRGEVYAQIGCAQAEQT
jgi:hypothetical protein